MVHSVDFACCIIDRIYILEPLISSRCEAFISQTFLTSLNPPEASIWAVRILFEFGYTLRLIIRIIMLGILSNLEISQVLKEQSIGRIGCYANGRVYIVPITYAYDGNYIYCHSREGQKVEMMRKNSSICFEVDVIENSANWKSIIVQGQFQELIGRSAREAMDFFLQRFRSQLMSETGIPNNSIGHFHEMKRSSLKSVIFRIKINEKTGRFEKQRSTFKNQK